MEDSPGRASVLHLIPVATHPTPWDPAALRVSMNLRLDGCIVPSEREGARLSYSHLAVLDDFLDDATRRELRDFLVAPQEEGGVDTDKDKDTAQDSGAGAVPVDRWERGTADMAGAAATWGIKPHVLAALAEGRPRAVVEVQSRLQRLYPEYTIVHMPSAAIQGGGGGGGGEEEGSGEEEPTAAARKRARHESPDTITAAAAPPSTVDCCAFLANAAVAGDSFRYHVDADPSCFPPGPWTGTFGHYANGEPGKPLLVTLLVYLNEEWERDWAGETLFLDGGTDTGVFVRPRAGRAVLMDQDVLHRVSAPSAAAGGRARLSLVWKLAFLPRGEGGRCCVARREWGPPVSFGSAARVEAVKRQLAQELPPKR